MPHSNELVQAYERTWKYWKDNQEKLLNIFLHVATEEYISIWKHESAFTTDECYDEQLKLYQTIQNERTLKNLVSADRILFTPIIEKGICYTGVRLIEIKEQEYDPDNIPQFWVVFEGTNFIGIVEENGGGMDDILCRHVQKYKETGKPLYFAMWRHDSQKRQKTSNIHISNRTFTHVLGRDGILSKFEKLSPYLSCMCMEPVTEDKEPFYTLPRGARPLGDYGIEQIYFIKKIVGKKWENCPVFYADLEFSEVNPLAENLVTFLKLACMAGSFLAVAGAVDVSTSEYERYLEGMQMDPEADAVIRLIEDSFPLPTIESVHAYVNNLQQNKVLKAMGEKLYWQIHKKRGWDNPED